MGVGQTVRLGKTNTLSCKNRMEIYFWFYDFLSFILLCEFYIFYLVVVLFVKSSESPSDGDFLGSLLHVWCESSPEPQLLKLLQRSGKDEGV